MKFYLSSYKLGSQENANKLKAMTVKHTRTAYISNALDFAKDIERRSKGEQEDMNDLKGI
jgi:dipeptidase E